jgi:anti-sigma regulatory factor (Ser/Thr protein kinase)
MVWQARRTFDNKDHAPRQARQFVEGCLNTWGVSEVNDRILLAVSELTTNAVVHGSGPVDVAVDATGTRLRVMVTDRGDGTPTLQPDAPGEPGGWGLRLVDGLTDRWGTDRRHGRTTVWFDHPLPPG